MPHGAFGASIGNMTNLHQALRELDSLSRFALKSGLPLRTLQRIKAVESHAISTTTRVALEQALRRYKPKAES